MTKSTVQIIPPQKIIQDIIFSPDGNHIYYRSFERANTITSTLFKVPVLGGEAVKVKENVPGQITFSPDGKEFAFVREKLQEGISYLVISDIEGAVEKILASRENDQWIHLPLAWSYDGKHFAFHGGLSDSLSGIITIDIHIGEEYLLNSEFWGAINELAWLSDGSGLMMSAAHQVSGFFYQIWFISFPEGKAHRITNDPNNYIGISLTLDKKSFITVKSDWIYNLWLSTADNPEDIKQISHGKFDGFAGVAWTPDGHIVHGSREWSIWLIDADGSQVRLLTGENKTNRWPDVSADGKYIIFESWRDDIGEIWQQGTYGGPAQSITKNRSCSFSRPQISPNDDWIVAEVGSNYGVKVAKFPSAGGDFIYLSEQVSRSPSISPDGKSVAFFQLNDNEQKDMSLIMVSLDGGEPQIIIERIPEEASTRIVRWTPDGKALTFILDIKDVSNLWNFPINGATAQQITHFDIQDNLYINAFDWSDNGDLIISRGKYDDDIVLISEQEETNDL